MPNDEKMSVDERRKYLKLVTPRYAKAKRIERSKLLTEIGEVTGLHRKSLIRLMHLPGLERTPKKPRFRRKRYGTAVADVVRVVWESLDYICAERLTPVLLDTALQLARWEEIELTPEVEAALGSISRATVQRLLQRFQQDTPKLPRRKPQPPNRLLREVPMGRLSWATDIPGSFETDLVHHCGPVAAGDYMHTLQLVDIATGWSERVAILGRSQEAMVRGFRKVQERLPFPIKQLHPDNGSEFFNHHMLRYWKEKVTGARLSRSRPYHKNDNPLVEQCNAAWVRAYLGYDRLDTVAQVQALNQLYDKLWVYCNFFQPMMRTTEKRVMPTADGGTRMQRRYDRARTPFERLCESGVLSVQKRQELQAIYDQTNPLQLREEIYALIDYIFSLPNAVPGVTEDVYQLVGLPSMEQAAD